MAYRKSLKFTFNTQGELSDEFAVSDFMSSSERARGNPSHVFIRSQRKVAAETNNYTIDLELKMENPDDPNDVEWFQLGNVSHGGVQRFSTQTLPFHGVLRLRAEVIAAPSSEANRGIYVFVVIG